MSEDNLEKEDSGPDVMVVPHAEERSVGLYGEVNEENAMNLVATILDVCKPYPEDELDPKSEWIVKPFDLYISTRGGQVAEMFAIYDTIRLAKKKTEITTIGLGKVMSAGVLLLAAGTHGKRKVTKNCRFMIHGAQSGYEGSAYDHRSHLSEIEYSQKSYINALAAETKMTVEQLEELIDQSKNHYFDAEQAIEWGIADEII